MSNGGCELWRILPVASRSDLKFLGQLAILGSQSGIPGCRRAYC